MPGASPEIDQELDPFDHPQSTMLGKALTRNPPKSPRNEEIQYILIQMGLISGGSDYFISISIHVSSLNFVVGSCKAFCPATVPQCRRDLVIVLPMRIWLVVCNIFYFSIQLGIIVPIDYIIF